MESSGKNFTPDKLPTLERAPLLAVCDRALRQVVELLQPQIVVGVGAFAEKCAKRALQDLPVAVGTILHPSPASPAANRGWQGHAEAQLRALGVALS
jgi:single-strand selective monofunctional uracil DNA glycosylase